MKSKTINYLNRNAIIILGLGIAYFPNYINRLLSLFNLSVGITGPVTTIIWNWLAVMMLLGYVFFIEKENLNSLLLIKPTEKDIEFSFQLWGLGMFCIWISSLFLPQLSNSGVSQITSLNIVLVIILIITTAITEEILYKGYSIQRMNTLFKNNYIGFLISFIIFIVPHVTFFGIEWLWTSGIGTIFIYIYYALRKNLWGSMLIHLLFNIPILIPTVITMLN